MDRKLSQRLFIGLALTVTVVGMAGAITPKAKNAPNAVAVPPPERMISYFEELGVDMSTFRVTGDVNDAAAEQMYQLYVVEDQQGDRVHSGRINGIAMAALAAEYSEVQAPVYIEFGPLYWGSWREKDGLSDD